MQLTEMKLSGFKSFVDPTTIKFPSNLMGVVGPNGCGKSNVIDAVRWVMGESSAKQLRGESMTDVIFSGSSARKPVTTATVELIFDNSDGRAGGEYASYSEISVKRQVSRDGTSNYYLNGTRCRRKDITDLFLGTGLGPRSYAIIEQGMISQIVEARPEELRAFLEEAAGISRYKERRKETENRIKHTRENLERLSDLREEVAKQLDKLKRQAKSAEKYRELKERYREDEAKLQALRWRELKRRLDQQRARIAKLQTELEARVAEQRGAEKDLEGLRQDQQSASENSSKIQANLYEVGAEIARLEQAIEHQREIRQRQKAEHAKIEKQMGELQQHLVLDKAQVAETSSRVAELEPALSEEKNKEREQIESLEEVELRMTQWQSRWDEAQSKRAEDESTTHLLKQRLEHLDEQMHRDASRKSHLESQSSDELVAQLKSEAQGMLERQEVLLAQCSKLKGEAEETKLGEVELFETIESIRSQLEGERANQATIKSRIEGLELLNRVSQTPEEGLAWLQQEGGRGLQIKSALEVRDTQWLGAVEQVLGQWLDAQSVESPVLDKAMAERRWGLSVVQSNPVEPTPGTLGAVVGNAGALGALLNLVWCAESEQAAKEQLARLASSESVVLKDGTWMGHGWLKQPIRHADAQGGVLAREAEVRALQPRLVASQQGIIQLEHALDEARRAHDQARQLLAKQLEQLQALERELSDVKGRLIGLESRRQSLDTQRQEQTTEIEAISKRQDENSQQVRACRTDLEQLLRVLEEGQSLEKSLIEEKAQLLSERELKRKQLTTTREKREELALSLQSARSGLESLSQSIERMDHQVGQLQSRYVELSHALAQGDAPVRELEQQRGTLLEQRLEVEGQMKAARARLEEIEEARAKVDQTRQGAIAAVEQLREQINEINLQKREAEINAENLQKRISDLKADLQELLAALPDDAQTQALQEQLEKIEDQIRKLEPVNLAAIEELAVESERKEYLDKQNADLVEALETLEKAIERIDRESRTRFKETFDQINSNIEMLFPRLFGGGHAHLEMVGNDWLSAGISIMARPPGKRVSRIHLMSGGEKALTAVAFVFAIFNLNPAPFCLLDEVDAPLDDANVGRFTEMVKEMSQTVQFIVVTHNKVTMEMAHQMLGVTMREPGVSRLVSVDLDKAVALAEA